MSIRVDNTERYSAEIKICRLDDYVGPLGAATGITLGTTIMGSATIVDLDLTGLAAKVDSFLAHTTDWEVERSERDRDVPEKCCGENEHECCEDDVPQMVTGFFGGFKKTVEEAVKKATEDMRAVIAEPVGDDSPLYRGVQWTEDELRRECVSLRGMVGQHITDRDAYGKQMHKIGYDQGRDDEREMILSYVERAYDNNQNSQFRAAMAEIMHRFAPAKWPEVASKIAAHDTFGQNKSIVRTEDERQEDQFLTAIKGAKALKDQLAQAGISAEVEIVEATEKHAKYQVVEDANIPENTALIVPNDMTPGEVNVQNFGSGAGFTEDNVPVGEPDYAAIENKLVEAGHGPLDFTGMLDQKPENVMMDPTTYERLRGEMNTRAIRDNPQA